MATIQSATGPIDTADMGFTLMHEHVAVRWPAIYQTYPDLWERERRMSEAVEKLQKAMATGVKTMVDLTPIDLGRDPVFIAEAARKSGMQVIVPTGLYYQRPFYFAGRPAGAMTDLFVRDITVGIGETGIRANVIKCATEPTMDAMNERVLRESARAHRQTGVPICTHTFPANRTGLDQQRVFREEGCDLGRIVIGHSDDTDDITYLEEIIQNGSFCGMDRIGLQRPRTDDQRADMVTALVEKGYADRITLSHDASCHIDFFEDGFAEQALPNWHHGFIATGFRALLKDRGVSDGAFEQMTVGNPRRIFEMNQPY